MSMNKPTNGNKLDEVIYQKELAQKRVRYAENTIVTDKLLIQKLDRQIKQMRAEKGRQEKISFLNFLLELAEELNEQIDCEQQYVFDECDLSDCKYCSLYGTEYCEFCEEDYEQ